MWRVQVWSPLFLKHKEYLGRIWKIQNSIFKMYMKGTFSIKPRHWFHILDHALCPTGCDHAIIENTTEFSCGSHSRVWWLQIWWNFNVTYFPVIDNQIWSQSIHQWPTGRRMLKLMMLNLMQRKLIDKDDKAVTLQNLYWYYRRV